MFTRINYLFITIIIGLLLVSSCFAASDSNLPYKEGELLVRFAPKSKGIHKTTSERNQILSSFNAGEVKHSFKRVSGLTLIKLPENLKVADALSNLKGKSEFLYVEPNYKIKIASTFPNDTNFPQLWGMHNTGQTGGTVNADINAPEAWDIIHDACDIIVAVLDTGIDYTHPDLAANMWTDTNGYHGYDFFNNDNDPMDDMYHGTHVAGIIGARGNNGTGVAGVCWNVKIMALKILGSDGYGDPYGWESDAIAAIEYAINKGAKILNNSWGGGPTTYRQALYDEIQAANAAGVLFIAATDNEGSNNDSTPFFPASYDCNNIISVMATDHNDQMASYSNYGFTTVDLGAPGTDILSTFPVVDTETMFFLCAHGGICYSTYYETISGTSMAAPHVAGACALVWAKNPFLTHLQVKEAVLESVDHLTSLQGLCVTGGRLNLHKAVNYYPSFSVTLTKTDDVGDGNCADIDSDVNYTICWSSACNANDVNIVDCLDEHCDFNSCTGGGVYDGNFHTVTWNLGDIDINDSNCFTVRVKVRLDAPQSGYITNTAKMYAGDILIKAAPVDTKICCPSNVVYVDIDAGDGGDGLSWATAYNNLQTALSAVRDGEHPCAEQIWVAEGNYSPTNNPTQYSMTFAMIPGIEMYGHFEGWETSIDQRNLADANYATILSGDVNNDGTGDIDIIVTAADNARLDGFTITKGKSYYYSSAVYCNSVSTMIANCVIKDNAGYGLRCQTGDSNSYDVSLVNCFVKDNDEQGICCAKDLYATGTLYLDISRCTISANKGGGLYIDADTVDANITDSIVSGNRSGYENSSGGIFSLAKKLTVKNCDITDNDSSGIKTSGSTPQLSVKNCVINENDSSGIYASSFLKQADIANNIIFENGAAGIMISDGTNINIMNNLIYRNGNYDGIRFSSTNSSLKIKGNTIAYNASYGIHMYGSGNPDVNSNIIWGNGGSLLGSFSRVNYNCIQGGYSGTGNTDKNPQFRNADANDFHLTTASTYCIDKGDPNFNSIEQDVNGQDRVMDGDRNNVARVDMGSDEFYPYDLVRDEFVNFRDFSVFAQAWGTHTGEPNYNDLCDFYDDGATDYIDYKDLYVFCEYWLCPADWPGIGGQGAYFADTGGGEMEMMMQEQEFSLAQTAFLAEQTVVSEAVAAQTEPQIAEVEPVVVDVNELLGWLDDLWQTDDEIRNSMSEAEYLEFKEAIEESEQ